MKIPTVLRTIILILALLASKHRISAQVSMSFQVFYDELSPYGYWIDNPEYGYVWIPNVSAGFEPYVTNGYWTYTDDGWLWVSYYPWGWAPFHYGRWYFDPTYGPVWVPDDIWGPGWVVWRRSPGYYGWAPLEPSISIGMALSNNYNIPFRHWRFVQERYFGRKNISSYYINYSENNWIIQNSSIITNTRIDHISNTKYIAGPNKIEVEKQTGKTISPITIKDNTRPGQNLGKNQIQIYRPSILKNLSTESKPAPSKVTDSKSIPSYNQRRSEIRLTPDNKKNRTQQTMPLQKTKNNIQSKKHPTIESRKQIPTYNNESNQKYIQTKEQTNIETNRLLHKRKSESQTKIKPPIPIKHNSRPLDQTPQRKSAKQEMTVMKQNHLNNELPKHNTYPPKTSQAINSHSIQSEHYKQQSKQSIHQEMQPRKPLPSPSQNRQIMNQPAQQPIREENNNHTKRPH